jgi:hypothetical protein
MLFWVGVKVSYPSMAVTLCWVCWVDRSHLTNVTGHTPDQSNECALTVRLVYLQDGYAQAIQPYTGSTASGYLKDCDNRLQDVSYVHLSP